MDLAEIKKMQRRDRRAFVERFLRMTGRLKQPAHRPKQKPAARILKRAIRAYSLRYDDGKKWGEIVDQIEDEFGGPRVEERGLRREIDNLLPEIAAARFKRRGDRRNKSAYPIRGRWPKAGQ